MKNPGVVDFWGFLLFTILILSGTGCAVYDKYPYQSSNSNYPVSFNINDVPFFPQEEFQCGPAALASVLNFRGYEVGTQEIAGAIYSDSIKGTLKMDMASFAGRYGDDGRISVSEVRGDLRSLKEDIAKGHPALIFADLGIWIIRKGHYMVIIGYDDARGGVIAYSGRERDKFIPYNRFMRMWERGGHWALRIVPAGQSTPAGWEQPGG